MSDSIVVVEPAQENSAPLDALVSPPNESRNAASSTLTTSHITEPPPQLSPQVRRSSIGQGEASGRDGWLFSGAKPSDAVIFAGDLQQCASAEPGPASYSPRIENVRPHTPRVVIAKSPRFVDSPGSSPGPGDYEVEKAIDSVRRRASSVCFGSPHEAAAAAATAEAAAAIHEIGISPQDLCSPRQSVVKVDGKPLPYSHYFRRDSYVCGAIHIPPGDPEAPMGQIFYHDITSAGPADYSPRQGTMDTHTFNVTFAYNKVLAQRKRNGPRAEAALLDIPSSRTRVITTKAQGRSHSASAGSRRRPAADLQQFMRKSPYAQKQTLAPVVSHRPKSAAVSSPKQKRNLGKSSPGVIHPVSPYASKTSTSHSQSPTSKSIASLVKMAQIAAEMSSGISEAPINEKLMDVKSERSGGLENASPSKADLAIESSIASNTLPQQA